MRRRRALCRHLLRRERAAPDICAYRPYPDTVYRDCMSMRHVHLWSRARPKCVREGGGAEETRCSTCPSVGQTMLADAAVACSVARAHSRVASRRAVNTRRAAVGAAARGRRTLSSRSCAFYNSMYDKSGELHKAHAYSVYSDYRGSRGRTRGHGQLEAQRRTAVTSEQCHLTSQKLRARAAVQGNTYSPRHPPNARHIAGPTRICSTCCLQSNAGGRASPTRNSHLRIVYVLRSRWVEMHGQ